MNKYRISHHALIINLPNLLTTKDPMHSEIPRLHMLLTLYEALQYAQAITNYRITKHFDAHNLTTTQRPRTMKIV